MAQTLQDQFLAAFLARGLKMKKRTFKYVVVEVPGTVQNYYLGRAGAVRIGRTIASSVPISEAAKDKLLSEAAALSGGPLI